MSGLSAALLDSLERLIPGGDPGEPELITLRQVVGALALALERGELALDLEGPAPDGVIDDGEAPSADGWPQRHLAALEARGWLVTADALEQRPEAPVVWDQRWLRWRRWHGQLCQCRDDLIARSGRTPDPAPGAAELERAGVRAREAGLDEAQARAVQALLSHRMVLLSGGPGTGKTSTVVQMLAAALRQRGDLRLQLAAPTGKAAARLGTAVAAGATRLEEPLAERLQALPCGTLHRLLDARGDGFRRGPGLPLEVDLLVIDEVSMVDLPLMAALLAALPEQAQLLLVGDPGQLPPVGPGAVLLELCRPEGLRALGPAAVELRTTYRNDGAIAALASRVRQERSRGPELLASLRLQLQALPPKENVSWCEAPGSRAPVDALERLRRHGRRLAALAEALEPSGMDAGAETALLRELESLILLSPLQRGPWGVEGVHRVLLAEALQGPVQAWPVGTPVLNRRNLPEQGLANGDVGVLVSCRGERLVLFPDGRRLHPARLGPAEPALALTVHKAQGSQYREVLLLLPPARHLDGRLLYTGLTRARSRARIYTAAPVVDRRSAVASGDSPA
ncbi:MAG: hypothetical protein RLZZ219_521 [Cyanobacteriota bacterium]